MLQYWNVCHLEDILPHQHTAVLHLPFRPCIFPWPHIHKYDRNIALMSFHALTFRPATKNTKTDALYPKLPLNQEIFKHTPWWFYLTEVCLRLSTSPIPMVKNSVQCVNHHKADGQQTLLAAHILIRRSLCGMTVKDGRFTISAIEKIRFTPCWPITKVS